MSTYWATVIREARSLCHARQAAEVFREELGWYVRQHGWKAVRDTHPASNLARTTLRDLGKKAPQEIEGFPMPLRDCVKLYPKSREDVTKCRDELYDAVRVAVTTEKLSRRAIARILSRELGLELSSAERLVRRIMHS